MDSLTNKNAKILFLTLRSFSLAGGIENVCKTFSKALAQLKEENKISAYLTFSLYDDYPDTNYIEKSSFKGFKGNKASFTLSVIKAALKVDVIVLSHIHLLLFGRIIKQLKPGCRIILLAHGIEVWKPLAAWKKHFLNETEIWAVSQYTASKLIEKNNLNTAFIKVLNNSLDPFFIIQKEPSKSFMLRERYNIMPEQKVLLTICRLSSSEQYKGYDLVIQCLKDLVKIQPNLMYLLVGKADADEQNRIKKLIKACKLEKNVICTGFIEEHELALHYQLADIFVMPSKAEGFGLVFIEAAVYGCTVIAGNRDGSRDALLNGEIGKLIDPENSDMIFQSILNSIEHPLTPNEIINQQQLVQQHFGFDNYKNNIYRLLMAG